jgi:hypothetical protein
MYRVYKDPSASLPYEVDWADWLPDGDTIASSTWVVEQGLTLVSSTYSSTTAQVVITGGTANRVYTITNQITTAAGLVDQRSIKLYMVER